MLGTPGSKLQSDRAGRPPRLVRLLALVAALASVAVPAAAAPGPIRHVILLIADGAGYAQADATAFWHGVRQPYEGAGWFHAGVSTFAWVEADDGPPYGDNAFVGVHGYAPTEAWGSWTYMQNYVTDSAAAATAMATGHKTYNSAIGMGVGDGTPAGRVVLPNLTEAAEGIGWATGVVTSVPFSHATPASFVAHNISRSDYEQIARDMTASDLEVVMGAGHPNYDDNGAWSPGNPAVAADWAYVGGYANWQALVEGTAGGQPPWTLIDDLAAFEALADGSAVPARAFGVAPVASTLQCYRAGAPAGNSVQPPYATALTASVPTLAMMVRGALNVLERDPNGFFLMVEGGAVDWAGHGQRLGRSIEEMDGFQAAVAAVVDWVETRDQWDETLVIVTSDHETGYLWRPGVVSADSTTWFRPLVDNGAGTMPGFRYYSAGHSNELVPLHARGRGVDLLAAAADRTDPRRGPFLDNTAIAGAVFTLLDSALSAPEPPPPLLALHLNRPNPFNASTTIPFELSRPGHASVSVFDARGRLVRTLFAGEGDSGRRDLRWHGDDDSGRPVASGVYLCRLQAEGETRQRMLTLVR